jgi:ADP-heptose:LPS heptosyltransferase
MNNPIVWMRGAVGDLLILFPIMKQYLNQEFPTFDGVNLIYSGPLQPKKVLELTDLILGLNHKVQRILKIDFDDVSNNKNIITDKMKEQCVHFFNRLPDMILNHVYKDEYELKIHDADNVLKLNDPIDYTSIHLKTQEIDLPFKEYICVSLTGNSNKSFQHEKSKDKFKLLINILLHETDLPILFLGGKKEEFDKLNFKSFRLINLCGQTSLIEVNSIIDKAKIFFCFDNGLKNIGFLSKTPTVFLFDKTWENANPIEAWFPKQLQNIKKNILLPIEEITINTVKKVLSIILSFDFLL